MSRGAGTVLGIGVIAVLAIAGIVTLFGKEDTDNKWGSKYGSENYRKSIRNSLIEDGIDPIVAEMYTKNEYELEREKNRKAKSSSDTTTGWVYLTIGLVGVAIMLFFVVASILDERQLRGPTRPTVNSNQPLSNQSPTATALRFGTKCDLCKEKLVWAAHEENLLCRECYEKAERKTPDSHATFPVPPDLMLDPARVPTSALPRRDTCVCYSCSRVFPRDEEQFYGGNSYCEACAVSWLLMAKNKTVRVTCPKCKDKHEIARQMVGNKIRCSTCGIILAVKPSKSRPASSSCLKKEVTIACSGCFESYSVPKEMAKRRKKCPRCGGKLSRVFKRPKNG